MEENLQCLVLNAFVSTESIIQSPMKQTSLLLVRFSKLGQSCTGTELKCFCMAKNMCFKISVSGQQKLTSPASRCDVQQNKRLRVSTGLLLEDALMENERLFLPKQIIVPCKTESNQIRTSFPKWRRRNTFSILPTVSQEREIFYLGGL